VVAKKWSVVTFLHKVSPALSLSLIKGRSLLERERERERKDAIQTFLPSFLKTLNSTFSKDGRKKTCHFPSALILSSI